MEKHQKKNAKLDLVKTKSNLKKLERMAIVLDELQQKLDELGDISALEDDPNLLHQLCDWVENISKIVLKGDEKRDLVIKLITKTFPSLNSEKDIIRLKKQIDHFCENDLIKKVKGSTVLVKGLCSFLSRRML